jgi:hypothetical protein
LIGAAPLLEGEAKALPSVAVENDILRFTITLKSPSALHLFTICRPAQRPPPQSSDCPESQIPFEAIRY